MTKRFLFALCLNFFFINLYSQIHSEIGLRYSAYRVWEVNAPEPEALQQDLDYYFSPSLTYQMYLLDNKVVLGVMLGMVDEIGENELQNTLRNGVENRRDIRNSIMYQFSVGTNLLQSKKGFLQINTGVRFTHTYFFSRSREIRSNNGTSGSSGGFEFDRWSNPKYSTILSIAYQRSLISKPRRKHSLHARLAWDFLYQFPVYYGTWGGGVVNDFPSLLTGPTVSLVWRIQGPKNRGLF
jgi:hypothetical protein